MCILCDQFAGGYERWYFNPANYARRLYKVRREESEVRAVEPSGELLFTEVAGSRAEVARDFLEARDNNHVETIQRIKTVDEERAQRFHLGQVITLDEALKICEIAYPIGLITCDCRRKRQALPDEENFICFGIGAGMYKWERWPETYRGGVDFLTPEEAKDVVTKLNRSGLVQIAITWGGTPYLGGVCNCEYPVCRRISNRLDFDLKEFWKGHYVARVDYELCNGCAQCVKRCQFKALNFAPTRDKVYIDMFQCFGCGLCASECPQDAITLVDRTSLPALANVW